MPVSINAWMCALFPAAAVSGEIIPHLSGSTQAAHECAIVGFLEGERTTHECGVGILRGCHE